MVASVLSGQFHDVSESTHWTPFLNASVHYIRKNYPLPWDEVGTACNPKSTPFRTCQVLLLHLH